MRFCIRALSTFCAVLVGGGGGAGGFGMAGILGADIHMAYLMLVLLRILRFVLHIIDEETQSLIAVRSGGPVVSAKP